MQVKNSYRNIWNIALPIILGSLVQSILSITNTAFLGRVGEITLGAAAIGGVFYFIFVFMLMGLAIGPQIIISRRTGENNTSVIGSVFNQSVYLMFLFAGVLFIILKFAGPQLIKHILSSSDIYKEAERYLSVISFSIFFSSINIAFRALYVGLSKTRILTYTMVSMVLLNILLDYTLIFGNFGFPRMGIKGAGISSLIFEIFGCLYFIIYTLIKMDWKPMGIFHFGRWNMNVNKEILHLSYPTVFQNVASIFSWFLFFVFIERTGEQPLAVSNIIRSVMLLFMMPVWGMATAASTMVGNLLGQDKKEEIFQLTWRIIKLGLLCMLVFLPVFLIKPGWYLLIYTNDTNLIDLGMGSLWVVYITMFVFVPASILFYTLMGTGDTKTTLWIEFSSIIVYLVYAYGSSIYLKFPLEFVWCAETIYWFQIGLLAWIRLKSLKWQKINV